MRPGKTETDQNLLSRKKTWRAREQLLTGVLPVETLHHQLQVFLVVLQVVNKLLEVQLPVRVLRRAL